MLNNPRKMMINILASFFIISIFGLLFINANKQNIVQIASFSLAYNEYNDTWNRIFL